MEEKMQVFQDEGKETRTEEKYNNVSQYMEPSQDTL